MPTDATVFLVDDDPAALDSIQFLLKSNGFSVEPFSSASEFLKSYDPNRPGCLVLDLCMPEMDGLALPERLLSREPRLPILFVTGHGDVPHCAQALKAGAVDFLEKPVRSDIILDRVRYALEVDQRNHRVKAMHPEIAARIAQLTPREKETMVFLLRGEDMKTISGKLDIGIQTVAKHRTRVLDKMQVRNEAELVRLLRDYPVEG
ncbi:MAG: response regulator transcription factor [Thermoguttaceae bacterium]